MSGLPNRPTQPQRPSAPNSNINSSSSSLSSARPLRPENPAQHFPQPSPVTSPYLSQYSPIRQQFPTANSPVLQDYTATSPQEAFRRQQEVLQQQMNFPQNTSQAAIGQGQYPQPSTSYYPNNPYQQPYSPVTQPYTGYPYNVQPQQSYFTPFPEPENAPFYHLAPAHIQPLYISQFMFNPAIELVNQEIALTESGNIIVDVPLSSQVLKDAKYTDSKEFTTMRYTPLTCSPNDFNEKYTLRANELKRDIKIAIGL